MFGMAFETLLANGGSGGPRWIASIRESAQAATLKSLSDEELSSIYSEMSQELARWLNGSSDRNQLGFFFAQIGKEYALYGVSLSELSLALALARKSTVRGLLDDGMIENSSALYALFDASERVADFYALGNYYLTKGFLESVIERITAKTHVKRSTIVEYFKDDLFYKG